MSKINCVVQDEVVIHIGDWEETSISSYSETGDPVYTENPLPDGAVQGEFEVEQTLSGKYVLSSNYSELRKSEYPSITDQLDALFHAGVFPDEMAKLIKAVKDKYPKN